MSNHLVDVLKKYNYVGIRTLTKNETYKIGDACRPSYDWNFEDDCSTYDTDNPAQLSGTSCIDVCIDDYDIDDWDENELIVDLYETIYNYGNGPKVLIAGDYATHGDDDAEIIISNAIVIHIKQ